MKGGFGNSHGMPIAEAMQGLSQYLIVLGLFRVGRATQSGLTGSCIGRYQVEPRGAIDLRKGCDSAAFPRSISKELLTSDAVSKSASPQEAITRLPRAGGSLPRLATADAGRRTQRTRGGRPAPNPPTHRSRLSELTRHHRPSCASMAQRDERAALPDHKLAWRSPSASGWRDPDVTLEQTFTIRD